MAHAGVSARRGRRGVRRYWGLDRKTDTVRGETLRNVVGGAPCGRLAHRHGWPELQVCSSRVLPPVCGVRLSLVLEPSGGTTSSWVGLELPEEHALRLSERRVDWFVKWTRQTASANHGRGVFVTSRETILFPTVRSQDCTSVRLNLLRFLVKSAEQDRHHSCAAEVKECRIWS